MNLGTQLVNFDPSPGNPLQPSSTPLYQTATFAQPSALEPSTYDYTRSGNPTRQVLEDRLCVLEGGVGALAYASGMAAVAAVCRLVVPGEEILASEDLYGGTWRFLHQVLQPIGVRIRLVDTTSAHAVREAMNAKVRLVLVESPSNPMMSITPLTAIAEVCARSGAWLAVDNSLMSPVLQRPLPLGADFVIHSATKFLGGHADVTAGIVVSKLLEHHQRLQFLQNAEGTALAPFEAWLLLRGLKTLLVRVKRQQQSAESLIAKLRLHPAVDRIYWPGCDTHPGFGVHAAQAQGPGSVFSLRMKNSVDALRLVNRTQLWSTTVSFGSVASTISLPRAMSHASITEVGKDAAFGQELVRMSVGLEDANDLVEDCVQALENRPAIVTNGSGAAP